MIQFWIKCINIYLICPIGKSNQDSFGKSFAKMDLSPFNFKIMIKRLSIITKFKKNLQILSKKL